MAKKFNKGRKQKRNIDINKLEKYREEISRELGINLPPLDSFKKSKKNEAFLPDTDDDSYHLP
ncbi:MAG: hypothetical protein GX364_01575 [Firmicutes bacterium]|nr:hypothetical protein [Bacillota bacterium]